MLNYLERINKANPRAYIFDLDGTLADTERLHWVAHNELLKKKFGITVDMEHIFSYLGKPESIFLKEIERDYNIDIGGPKGKGYEKYSKERNKIATKLILKEGHPYQYVRDLLVGSFGIKIFLVSAQNRSMIHKMLGTWNLLGKFTDDNTFVVEGDKTKPYYYDYIFKNILKNAKPEEVIFFEDVNKYLKEGKARGFVTIGINNGFGNETLEADYIIDAKANEMTKTQK